MLGPARKTQAVLFEIKPTHPPVLRGGRDGSDDAGDDEYGGDGCREVDDGGEGDVALGEEGEEGALAEMGPGGGGGHQDAAQLLRGGDKDVLISMVPLPESAIWPIFFFSSFETPFFGL